MGLTGGYRDIDRLLATAAPIEARAWTVGAYAAVEVAMGLYARASGAWLGRQVQEDRALICLRSAGDRQNQGRRLGRER
ncbi:hypothetical protein NOVOSPHI9U_770008 [Novosphingobium sp. 9U]|nr:hypothetical protein NOVOSPHI9U_770008 [Novosphingobium sp. 9U]